MRITIYSPLKEEKKMKTKRSLAIAIGVLFAFVAGILVGLALTNPGMSIFEAAGTIGKVDKYRNVKVTEHDIELRNNLLEDASLKEAYKNYLLYEYTANVKMADDIIFAIEAAGKAGGFRAANVQSLDRLEDYAYFLDNARLQILEAIATLNELGNKSQIAIQTVMNNAGNAMAQTTYRSNVLFDFITAVERFFESANKEEHPELATAHDLLFANLFIASIVNENTPALQYLSGRELFTENESLALKDGVIQGVAALDAELLSVGFTDKESMLMLILSSDQMRVIYLVDGITLQGIIDTDQSGSFRSHGDFLDLLVVLSNDATGLQGVMQNKEAILGSVGF